MQEAMEKQAGGMAGYILKLSGMQHKVTPYVLALII